MLTVNGIFLLNILLDCVPCNELRSIASKLEIKLAGATIKGAVGDTLRVRVKLGVLGAEYKEPTYEKA